MPKHQSEGGNSSEKFLSQITLVWVKVIKNNQHTVLYACIVVCPSMCLCLCVHVCVHVSVFMCMCLCVWTHVCMHACVCSRVCSSMCVCLCLCVSVCVNVWVCICVHVCAFACLSLCARHGAPVDMIRVQPNGNWFPPSTTWVPGLTLRSPTLVERPKCPSCQCLVGASLQLQSAVVTCICAVPSGFRCKNKNQ